MRGAISSRFFGHLALGGGQLSRGGMRVAFGRKPATLRGDDQQKKVGHGDGIGDIGDSLLFQVN